MAVLAHLVLALFVQEPEHLHVGNPISGEIGANSAHVRTPSLDAEYAFAPTAGNSYSFQAPSSGIFAFELKSYDFDAYLVVTDPGGELLAENDDGILTYHSQIVLDLQAGQKCVVTACALAGRKGQYQLTATAGHPASLSMQEQLQADAVEITLRLQRMEATFGRESSQFASPQSLLGAVYYQLGEYEKAQAEWGSCFAIQEKLLGPEHPKTVTILNNLAVLLYDLGEYEQALPLFKRSAAFQQKVSGPDHPDTAVSISNLASLYDALGRYEDARPLYERSLAIQEKALGPDHPDTAWAVSDLADLLFNQGFFAEARPLFERSLAIREEVLGPDHPETSDSLNNLAQLFHFEGNYELARQFYERSLDIRLQELGPDHPDTAISQNNLGQLLHSQGDFDEARQLLERALAAREEIFGPEHPDTSETLNNLAALLFDQGKLEEARPLYQRSLAIAETVLDPEHPEIATTLSNLGSLLQAQGDFKQARTLHERSLAIRQLALGLKHPDVALSLNNLAALAREQGNYADAEQLLERARTILERVHGSDHPTTASCLANQADVLRSQGKHRQALPILQEALSRSLAHLDRELPTMSEAGRFRLLEISASPETYLHSLASASPADLSKPYSLFQTWKGKATRLQSASVELSSRGNDPAIQQSKAQIQELANQLSRLVLAPLDKQEEDHAQQIDSLRRKRLQLERELNRKVGLDSALAAPDLAKVQQSLPADAVLIDFFVGEQVYAWVVKNSGLPQLFSLGDADGLNDIETAFLNAQITRGGRALLGSKSSSAADYFESIWQPLRESVGKATTVFISPDGFLCELPFGILQDKDGSYLLEKHQFVYLSDPTRLVDSEAVDGNQQGAMLAVGGVNYVGRDEVSKLNKSGLSTRSRVGSSWRSLPGTVEELQDLRDLHSHALEWESPMVVVEGMAATEERIRAELPGKKYVHIATHGYFEPEHLPSLLLDAKEKRARPQLGQQIQAVGLLPGLLSGLVFAGVNSEPDPSRDDGYLSAEEIQYLDLSKCDLVVLSACETALGSARAGEGLMSLRRAFSVAGADTVISSLWKVDDESTAQLMNDFYTNLWEQNMSRGEALHEAKLRMLRRNRIDNGGDALPSTWGAFVLSGEWN